MRYDDNDKLLLVGEVATICRTSPETVRFWIRSGRLPSVRPGRRRLISRADLNQFLERSPRPCGRPLRRAKTNA